jgi:group I intron endonuclease
VGRKVQVHVYEVTCRETAKRYIGITKKTSEARWAAHCAAARRGKHAYSRLHNAIRKYGQETFTLRTLVICGDWDYACDLERKLIAAYGTFSEGYNATEGGEGAPGFRPSAATLAKLSAARRGKPKSEEWKAKIGAANRGRKPSPEHIARLAELKRGQKQSPETIERRALKLRGKKRSDETRARMSAAQKGKPMSEYEKMVRSTPEYREKMRQNVLKRWAKVRAENGGE